MVALCQPHRSIVFLMPASCWTDPGVSSFPHCAVPSPAWQKIILPSVEGEQRSIHWRRKKPCCHTKAWKLSFGRLPSSPLQDYSKYTLRGLGYKAIKFKRHLPSSWLALVRAKVTGWASETLTTALGTMFKNSTHPLSLPDEGFVQQPGRRDSWAPGPTGDSVVPRLCLLASVSLACSVDTPHLLQGVNRGVVLWTSQMKEAGEAAPSY